MAVDTCTIRTATDSRDSRSWEGSRAGEWLSLALVFVALPAAIGVALPPFLWVPALWVVAAWAGWRVRRESGVRPAEFWSAINWRRAWPELRRVALRFAVCAMLLGASMAWLAPERLFDLPRERPGVWLAILALYPALSVFPQEVLYRRFFFHRVRRLLGSETAGVWESAIVFAAMHAIFRNGYAVVLSLVGGWLFADTYRRTGSLRLVCLEHALYGCMLFTFGLGDYFSHGEVSD